MHLTFTSPAGGVWNSYCRDNWSLPLVVIALSQLPTTLGAPSECAYFHIFSVVHGSSECSIFLIFTGSQHCAYTHRIHIFSYICDCSLVAENTAFSCLSQLPTTFATPSNLHAKPTCQHVGLACRFAEFAYFRTFSVVRGSSECCSSRYSRVPSIGRIPAEFAHSGVSVRALRMLKIGHFRVFRSSCFTFEELQKSHICVS